MTNALTAIDLLAFTQTGLLHDMPGLAKAEPKTLRHRLLHTAPGWSPAAASSGCASTAAGPGPPISPRPSNACRPSPP